MSYFAEHIKTRQVLSDSHTASSLWKKNLLCYFPLKVRSNTHLSWKKIFYCGR